MDRQIDVAGIYLCEVSNIEQVKGLKQFTLPEMKPLLTNSQKLADILQAQELNTETQTLLYFY